MKAAHVAIALLLLGLCVAWLAWTGSDKRAAAIAAAPEAGDAVSPAKTPADRSPYTLTHPAPIDPITEEAAAFVESARTPVVSEATPVRKAGIGRLIVRAVDATTNEPLRYFGVRLVSDTRFASERSHDTSDEIELPLTPDTYSIVVSAPGYESVELPPAKVTADETNRLAPANLRPGSGSIWVDVSAAAFAGRSLYVELIGAGRRPCERCADTVDATAASDARARAWERTTPCASCGFAREQSRLPLSVSPNVEFASLGSGNYALRVSDDHGLTVCQERELVLRNGERARVAFDVSSLRFVELECFDTDGRSLTEEWRSRLADTQEDEAEIVSGDSGYRRQVIALEFSDDSQNRVATASILPPIPRGSAAVSIGVGRRASDGLGSTRRWFDRERRRDDTLWPEPAAAGFGPTIVACDIEDNGIARVGPLPSSLMELHATAAHFIADAVVPSSRATTRIALKLRTKPLELNATPEPATFSAFEMAGVK
jgi:hypothetical protein